ncbi:SLBB domain-containing protein [Chromobacterium sp. IIBBL 290-4]|uniref:SLBB domain-containing protein n=1 Tax=Chromobacterium sp. IIBBL 290-4 TaxID=2953890 RepID=UPI0020B77D12|nr:SLBB domain-containing protein [Chromobacterium sp. IIBBL 290-4]UTH75324.1 SLBB domain-containing protein [Chromobacterium sp. IIBBL 290-4]
MSASPLFAAGGYPADGNPYSAIDSQASLGSDGTGLPSINGQPSFAGRNNAQPPSSGESRLRAAPFYGLDENGYPLDKNGLSKLPPFTEYVKQAADKILPMFGSRLFNNPNYRFDSLANTQVNPDYVIGSGDQLQIKGWGMVDIDLTLTVDRNGAIYLPRVGGISVAGVKYRDLQGVLKKSVSRVFNNFDLSVSLLQNRSVQIYVVGHARQPGSYTLNGMSTVLNALLQSGGPNDSGSLRQVKLMRDGKEVATVDLYSILVDGDKSADQSLRDGDVIQIPAAGPRVALLGDVKTPAIYEFKPGETSADLLRWAGGLESAAEGKELLIEKSVDNRFVKQASVLADPAPLRQISLAAGDIFRLNVPNAQAVTVRKGEQFVTVSGEAKTTGTFQLRKGETLRQLLMRLGGAGENGYIFGTELKRESIREMQQQKLDEVATRFEKDLEQNASVKLAKLTDKDAIAAANAEVDGQRRLAAKMRTIRAEGRVVLEMKDGTAEAKDLPDLELKDGDKIEIPQRPGTVNVLGAVYQTSAFIYRPQRNVSDYLSLAGGATPSADKSSTYVLRADGTVASSNNSGWFGNVSGMRINPGDTVVVPEDLNTGSWVQSLKEWTSILYQFGLGAAGLKVLK